MIRAVEARGALDISRRLKQGVSQVFRFAIANGWAGQDPTVHLLGALKPQPRVRHMARVPMKEFPDLVRAIVNYDGEETPRRREVTRDALMFTLLTLACCRFDGHRDRLIHATPASRSKSMGLRYPMVECLRMGL